MQLGWIDFSKSERSKILSVLDLLTEAGTLDELGIAPIRDGFANIFFPGTSTIQTRAKYFFIIPYILKDLERSNVTNPNELRRMLDEIERKCGEHFFNLNRQEPGLIGRVSLANKKWVKRAPSEIYWNGMRQYRIFTGNNMTLTEYLRISAGLKKRKSDLKKLGNRNDGAEENECDDKDAGNLGGFQFWNIPSYPSTWKEDLQMKLTHTEASFLKAQIIANHPNSMLGHILRENMVDVLDCEDFDALSEYIDRFPQQIQDDYWLALSFSHFLYIIRVVYNMMVSDGQNENATQAYEEMKPYLLEDSNVDLDAIISRLGIAGNVALCKFLNTAKTCIQEDNFEGLCKCIKDREILLKGTGRAKTAHPGEFDPTAWFGGGLLEYRFPNTQTILRDIFEGEVTDNAES